MTRLVLTSLRISIVLFAALALISVVACGGSDSSSSSGSAAQGAGSGSSGDAPSKTMAETAQQISADAQKCLDLVKAGQYSQAIAPCERAAKDTASAANADVKAALAEAQTAVKEEAQKAATAAAAAGLEGGDPAAAATDSAKGMLGGN